MLSKIFDRVIFFTLVTAVMVMVIYTLTIHDSIMIRKDVLKTLKKEGYDVTKLEYEDENFLKVFYYCDLFSERCYDEIIAKKIDETRERSLKR